MELFEPNALKEDTVGTVPEAEWYKPEEDSEAVQAFCAEFQGAQTVHCLDAFGASRSMYKQWNKAGMNARAFDVKLNPLGMDLLTRTGFFTLLTFGMSLIKDAMVVAGLPCQWFVWLSCSVHRRHELGPLGLLTHPKVRLANRIVDSFVYFIEVLSGFRTFYVLFEQPRSSWMFQLPSMLRLTKKLNMKIVSTALGCFGHDLEKPTRLLTDVPGAEALARTVNKEQRKKIALRLEKRNAKRSKPRVYYEVTSNGQKKTVTGSKDLAKSAAYPAVFSQAVLKVWRKAWVKRLFV